MGKHKGEPSFTASKLFCYTTSFQNHVVKDDDAEVS